MQWLAVDHIDWAPTGEPSVQACREKVAGCALMVLLVAHRYGYVPSVQLGGDGRTSITRMEYQWAREWRIPVVLFLCDEQDGWPEAMIERHATPRSTIRSTLSRQISAITSWSSSRASREHPRKARGISRQPRMLTAKASRPAAFDILPTKLPYLCDRSQQSRLVRQRLQSHLQSHSTRPSVPPVTAMPMKLIARSSSASKAPCCRSCSPAPVHGARADSATYRRWR